MKFTSFFFPLSLKEKTLLFFWILFSLALFFYSFTQIDLGLVVSRYPFFYGIEKSFQYIGYFRRDISAYLYLGIMGFGFSLFGYTLFSVIKKYISPKGLFVIVGTVSLLLAFSYNALSYDFFNYIFDAKILTHYHLNPYQYKALDFPGDPMLGFMHWTHRTYPYGPLWLVLTVPLSFIASNIFIITFFLFKLLTLAAYVIFAWYFYKVAVIVNEKRALFATTFLVLNPLFLAEFLVSGHNDSSMFALAFGAIYYLLKRKQLLAYVLLAVSIGVKFATGFLLAAFLLVSFYLLKKRNIPIKLFIHLSTLLMIIAFVLVSYRTIFEPWYLIYIFPFMLLMPWKKETGWFIGIMSILSSTYYFPYLLTGQWNESVMGYVFYNFQMSVFPICLFLIIIYYLLQVSYLFIDKKSYV